MRPKDNLIKLFANCITHHLHRVTVRTQGWNGSSPYYVVLPYLNNNVTFTGLLGTCNHTLCNDYPAFLESRRSVSANLASLFLLKTYLLTLLCKTASFVISTLSLQTDEVLKVPGNTEDNILSFPNLKGFVFLPPPAPLRRTRLVFVNKNKSHHKQSRPKQQAHLYICTTPSNRKPEENSTNIRPQWGDSKAIC